MFRRLSKKSHRRCRWALTTLLLSQPPPYSLSILGSLLNSFGEVIAGKYRLSLLGEQQGAPSSCPRHSNRYSDAMTEPTKKLSLKEYLGRKRGHAAQMEQAAERHRAVDDEVEMESSPGSPDSASLVYYHIPDPEVQNYDLFRPSPEPQSPYVTASTAFY